MRKYFCDRCGRETAMVYLVSFHKDVGDRVVTQMREICPECEKSFTEWWKGNKDGAESEVRE